jgi:hypothetical protein
MAAMLVMDVIVPVIVVIVIILIAVRVGLRMIVTIMTPAEERPDVARTSEANDPIRTLVL